VVDELASTEELFHRYDDMAFWMKYLARFGSLTISTTLAYGLCYPLDTLKRRMQAEGSPGFKFTNTNNEVKYAAQMLKNEGILNFYRGFVPGMCRVLPMSLLNYIIYENLSKTIR
jgi:solute carrier family 25 (mitochondrial phosphate transporter), member 23/24/25/41